MGWVDVQSLQISTFDPTHLRGRGSTSLSRSKCTNRLLAIGNSKLNSYLKRTYGWMGTPVSSAKEKKHSGQVEVKDAFNKFHRTFF